VKLSDCAHYGRAVFLLLTFLLFGAQGASANFATPACRDMVMRLSSVSLDNVRGTVRPSFGYRTTRIGDKKHLQFGFESEYTLREIDEIVTVYGPTPELMPTNQWNAMSVADRSQWVRDNLQRLFPESRTEGNFVRLVREEGMDFLPDRLIFDDTGNIEFVLRPFDTFEDWYQSVSRLNQRFGTGSMQGTISAPPTSFFGRIRGMDQEVVTNEKMGMFNFYLDYDIIQKLSAGATRYNNDSSQMVARNFEHPFLGPMTAKRQDILDSTLRGNAIGQKYEAERMARIAGWENSFKYVGGTVYRPDILGEKRVILEIRDAHKNFNLLTDRLLRAMYFSQHGTQGLDRLKDLRHFDPEETFQKFPAAVKRELERLFPNKANPNYEYDPEIKKVLDVFKNFSYPLRDWSQHLDVLGVASLRRNVDEAQAAYVSKLQEIVRSVRRGAIDDEEAKRQIHGALANFVQESGIARAFNDYEQNQIFRNAGNAAPERESFSRFVREATVEAGPLRSSFPERVLTGPLKDRMEQLMAKWPNNMKKVPAVDIKFNNGSGGKRDIVFMSFDGLSAAQKREFLDDYFHALSDMSVSFPLSESAGHLYTRIGNKTVDFYFGSNVNSTNYALPNSDRLEAFVQLDPQEFLRLRTYIENGQRRGSSLLGSSGYDGVNGPTNNTLTNNRPTSRGESHNCTSWICTSPIGNADEALHDLVRAPRSHRVHTNPGWWSSWLMNYSPRERVPFAVYMTNDSLDSAISSRIRSNTLNWNFGVH
jgi:hypothetical protein